MGKMSLGGEMMHIDEPFTRRQVLARWIQRASLLPALRNLNELVWPHDLRVLAYHRVLETTEPADFGFDLDLISASAEAFRRQMSHVKRHFTPMRFDEVVARIDRGQSLPRDAVLITFDDGYDDNYRIAFPILRELGMSAMFFVSTGYIDSGRSYSYDWLVHMLCSRGAGHLRVPELDVDWRLGATLPDRRAQAAELLLRMKALDAQVQDALILRLEAEWGMPRAVAPAQCRPMNWDQLRAMRAAGMEVGSHGVSHHMLAKLPRERMVDEVVESRRTLQRELGDEIIALSYPVGGQDAYSAETVAAVRGAGYRIACNYTSGVAVIGHTDLYALPRLAVERQMDQTWFKAMLAAPGLFTYATKRRGG